MKGIGDGQAHEPAGSLREEANLSIPTPYALPLVHGFAPTTLCGVQLRARRFFTACQGISTHHHFRRRRRTPERLLRSDGAANSDRKISIGDRLREIPAGLRRVNAHFSRRRPAARRRPVSRYSARQTAAHPWPRRSRTNRVDARHGGIVEGGAGSNHSSAAAVDDVFAPTTILALRLPARSAALCHSSGNIYHQGPAFARLLIAEPEVAFLDEAVSALPAERVRNLL